MLSSTASLFWSILGRIGVDIGPYLAGLGHRRFSRRPGAAADPDQFSLRHLCDFGLRLSARRLHSLESGLEGTVEEIGWRITKIRHWQGNLAHPAKYQTLGRGGHPILRKTDLSMIFGVDGGVSYDSDLERVEQVILEVANRCYEEQPGRRKGFHAFSEIQKFRRFQHQFFCGDESAKPGRDFRFGNIISSKRCTRNSALKAS